MNLEDFSTLAIPTNMEYSVYLLDENTQTNIDQSIINSQKVDHLKSLYGHSYKKGDRKYPAPNPRTRGKPTSLYKLGST